ncbi:MAG: hypothetical protein EXR80_10620 [Methylococcales bacterium]|nr:hypothetical protein [Methylococcales bacterium]
MKLKTQILAIGMALSTGIANAEPAKPVDNAKKSDSAVTLDTLIVRAQSENKSNQPFESCLKPSKIIRSRTATSDTALMFDHTPGVSFSGGGGISSRHIINGMADDRIRIQIDGMNLISACGNHMNPPLSYVAPSSVLSAQIMAGITPVSMGGDSIAGTIRVQSADPQYTEDGKKYGSGLNL